MPRSPLADGLTIVIELGPVTTTPSLLVLAMILHAELKLEVRPGDTDMNDVVRASKIVNNATRNSRPLIRQLFS